MSRSNWISRHRGAGPSEAAHGIDPRRYLGLDRRVSSIEAFPVRVEILSGASRADRPRLKRVLSALPIALPTERTWPQLDRWIDISGDAGQRFGFADMLIAALAVEADGDVWSLDSDFVRMARLGMIRLHRPGA